jgi:hypothetical protein
MKQIEVKLIKEFSSHYCEPRLYVKIGDSIYGSYADTELGRQEATRAYNYATQKVRETGSISEVLLKEVVSVGEKS